jgi:predicted nucleic acid-binding protein
VSPNGLWIAASAAQHGLRVVTLDRHFDRIPQVLVTRFETPRDPEASVPRGA